MYIDRAKVGKQLELTTPTQEEKSMNLKGKESFKHNGS